MLTSTSVKLQNSDFFPPSYKDGTDNLAMNVFYSTASEVRMQAFVEPLGTPMGLTKTRTA